MIGGEEDRILYYNFESLVHVEIDSSELYTKLKANWLVMIGLCAFG
ncbi:MAG: hypothetical protein QM800_02635 [Paludibacter sp.]